MYALCMQLASPNENKTHFVNIFSKSVFLKTALLHLALIDFSKPLHRLT